jgi:ankyrin repeat protein
MTDMDALLGWMIKTSNEDILYNACENKEIKYVKLLIDHGANITRDCVEIACEKDHIEILQILLDSGSNQSLMLYDASRYNCTEIVRRLLALNKDLHSYFKNSSHTPLVIACKLGYIGIVKILVDHDSYKHRSCSNYPLWMASKNGYIEIVKILLNNDAIRQIEQEQEEHNHFRSLTSACQRGYVEIVHVLLDYYPHIYLIETLGNIPLREACRYGQTNVVTLLLQRGADINSICYRETHLQTACKYVNIKTARFLIENGINIDYIDDNNIHEIYKQTYLTVKALIIHDMKITTLSLEYLQDLCFPKDIVNVINKYLTNAPFTPKKV